MAWDIIQPAVRVEGDDDDDDDVIPLNDILSHPLRVRAVGTTPTTRGDFSSTYAVVPDTNGTQMVRGGSNERNVFPRDRRVRFIGGEEFPDEHYYMIDGDRTGISSATGLLHLAFAPFEAKRMVIARACSKTRNASNRYFGKTVDEVLGMWDEARDTGSAKHAAIDDFLQARPFRWHQQGAGHAVKYPPPGLYAFLRRHPTFEVVRTEWSIFCEARLLAGQLDALFYCTRQQTHIVVDWKNVENFTVKNSVRGIHPLTHAMPDCHLSHYTLQLNIYRHMIERYYDLKIGGMIVVNIPPSRTDESHEYIIWPLDVTPLLDLMPLCDEGRERLAREAKRRCPNYNDF